MTTEFRNVSVLVAAMNETFSLDETVRTLRELCAPGDLAEILLLLHPERTTPECRARAEAWERAAAGDGGAPVRIVTQRLPGPGGAYQTGFEEARGSHVVMISADLETHPKTVPAMIEEAKRRPDGIVTASRWMKGGSFRGYNPVKYLCNAVFQRLMAALFWTRLNDITFGFRLFPTELTRRIDWKERYHPFFLETAAVPLRLGVRFTQIPTSWEPRPEGESQNSFFANFKYFKTALRVRLSPRESLLKPVGGGEKR